MRTPTALPTSSPMSPTQVAQATNTSRRTVMRAIDAQELQAFRDNRNHWKITPEAIEQWALAQHAPSAHAQPLLTAKLPPAHSAPTSAEAGALEEERQARRLAEVEAAELRGKLVATEAERDRLHCIIQNMTTLPTKRRRWWPF